MAHFHDNALVGASGQGGYQISRSLRFNSADSAYLNRTFGTPTNANIWTYSAWVKRSTLGIVGLLGVVNGSGDTNNIAIRFVSDQLSMVGGTTSWRITTQLFRDVSAWYHIVLSVDTTQSTANNRIRIYINGSEITTFATLNNPTQNTPIAVNTASAPVQIGAYNTATFFNGYLTEIHFIDGQALTPSSFGETDTITGVWKPKKYAGTYGTNGFYLNFSDNSGTTSTTLGKDSSGNSNNWTPNNFSVTAGAGNDSLIDTPTPYADGGNGRGNYCTLNPLNNPGASSLSNGNLDVTTASSGNGRVSGTLAVSNGKWYWEVTPTNLATNCFVGIASSSEFTANYPGSTSASYGYVDGTGNKYNNGVAAAYGATYVANDVIGVALDLDAGTIVFYKNGVSQGTAYSGLSGSFVSALSDGGTGQSVFTVNFGQRPFAYTPPSGFVALNTQNLPEPSIKKPSSYFNTILWSGNNANPRTITGVGFQPDFVWLKDRTQATNHRLSDAVRGSGFTLKSNTTDAETSSEVSGAITAFTSDGFTVQGTSNVDGVNLSGDSYVAWCWDESATPGFDIVAYTGNGTAGRTISHNLGVAPSLIIAKGRTNTDNWPVGHASRGWDRHLLLNSTAAEAVTNTTWNNTAPTSSVFTVGSDARINQNTITYVAYLWSEVAGFSKFGSYTGNGSSDGPFCFCGFRPRFVMFKRTDSTGSWFMEDSARGTYNVMGPELYANLSDAESTVSRLDFLSNGFKMRAANAGDNASGGTYIFAAFSESAFKYSLAR